MTCDHKNNNSCLFKVPIFSHLNELEQSGIANLINSKKLSKGEYLYNMGEQGSSLYVVNSGKIKISRYSEDGNEQVIRILQAGDFTGEHALFTLKESNDFAISLEESSICILQGDTLKEYMGNNPEIAIRIITELSNRLSDTENKLESSNLASVEKRLASSILELANDNNHIILPISKGDWASMLGMGKEALSRKLSEFKRLGYIELKGQREIFILNFDELVNIE